MRSRAVLVFALFSGLVAACGETPADNGGGAGTAGTGGAAQAGNAGAGVSGSAVSAGTGGSAGTAAAGGVGANAGGGNAGAAGRGGTSNMNGGSSGAGGTSSASGGTAGDGSAGTAGDDDAAGGDAGSENVAGASSGGAPSGTLDSFELAVIGSSTSAGEGASDESLGWVSLLAEALDERVTVPFDVRNLSVSGYSSSQLSPGSGSDGSIDDAIDEAPNLILVALAGSNDLGAGVSEETFLSRLRAIRDTANEAGIPIFFLSTAPKDLSQSEREALRDWALAMRDGFEQCWVPHSSAYEPCFIDVFEPLANGSLGIRSEYGAGDGIHLNDDGHAAIFEAVEPIVATYVCAVAACD